MATVLAPASYSRIGFSSFLAIRARLVRVPVGSAIHLEPGTIGGIEEIRDDEEVRYWGGYEVEEKTKEGEGNFYDYIEC